MMRKNNKINFPINDLFYIHRNDIDFKGFLLLLENITGLSKEMILSESTIRLDHKELRLLESYINRFKKGEPIEYIIKRSSFRDNSYFVTYEVLIPRVETERLIEIALELYLKNKLHSRKLINILEVGIGSGCISIELALLLLEHHIRNFQILGTDISRKAINIAKKNINNFTTQNPKLKGLITLQKSDIIPHKTQTKFDIIISNPPYIPTKEMNTLPNSVKKYEPHIALDGGTDGFGIFKKIIRRTVKNRTPKTTYIFEIHSPKAKQFKLLLYNLSAKNIQFFDDQFKRKRFVLFTLP